MIGYLTAFFIVANILLLASKRIGMKGFLPIFLISALVAFIPLGRLSVADYILSVNPNFSIGSFVFLGILLLEKLTKKSPFSQRERLFYAFFNVLMYAPLSASALGFWNYDMYGRGYGVSLWFLPVFLASSFAIIKGNWAVSLIFIAIIAGYDLKLLESANFFDYVTDTVLFFISAFIIIRYAITKGRAFGSPSKKSSKDY